MVILCQRLIPETIQQGNLLLQNYDPERQQRLMSAIDGINNRFGRNTVFWGVAGIDKSWQRGRHRLTPRYTTSWVELPVVKASNSLMYTLVLIPQY